jgi:two-component system cell cycle sensor histidine kinase/response regulator CckA
MPERAMDRVILLVDDESTVLAVLSRGLQQAGFRVVTARSAHEALKRAKQLGRIDLLASDVVLPEKLSLARDHRQRPVSHGIALMRKLLSLDPGLRVVLFSGQSEEMIQSLGGIPEGTAFLRKPFSSETLVRCINKVLDGPPPVRG